MCVVGDVLRSRKAHGVHQVLPLADEIRVRVRRLGLQALHGPVWAKRGNCSFEQGGNGVLGTPSMPRGVVPMGHERILLFKKPGPYRSTTPSLREAARLAPHDAAAAYRDIWTDVPGASTRGGHPAPFPLALARRIILSQTFPNDTVCDPFSGSGTTAAAALETGRNSVGIEICGEHFRAGVRRVQAAAAAFAGLRAA